MLWRRQGSCDAAAANLYRDMLMSLAFVVRLWVTLMSIWERVRSEMPNMWSLEAENFSSEQIVQGGRPGATFCM